MPSPVGHSLAAVALLQVSRRFVRTDVPTAIAVVVASSVADLDFLPGILIGYPERFHHHGSHSLLAAVLFGLGSALLLRAPGVRRPFNVACLTGFAYASHLLLDMLSTGGRPHYGVPLFWPFSELRVNLPFDVFAEIMRGPSSAGFLAGLMTRHNWGVVVQEIVVMGSVVAVLYLAGLVFSHRSTNHTTRPDPPSDSKIE